MISTTWTTLTSRYLIPGREPTALLMTMMIREYFPNKIHLFLLLKNKYLFLLHQLDKNTNLPINSINEQNRLCTTQLRESVSTPLRPTIVRILTTFMESLAVETFHRA